jgi:hypothetical protein
MYLLDTNVWLERLLNQEKAEEVGEMLDSISSENLYITDFALHSVGVILCKLNKKEAFIKFIEDLFVNSAVNLIHIEPQNMKDIIATIDKFNLDFDDAYQYVAAEKYALTIISFDTDFDRTERGRKTPAEVLK